MIDLILFPLKLLLISIDLVITIVTFGWVGAVKKFFTSSRMRSVPVDNDQAHRVHPDFKEALAETPRPGVNTLYDLMVDAVKSYGPRNCMASREFLGWKSPKVKHFGDGVSWLTFNEMNQKALKFGAALRATGMVPAPDTTNLDKVKSPCRFAIFENTCAEWMIAAMGAFSQGITVTTVYATLGMDAVVEAIEENIIPIILCNKKDVAKLVEKCKKMPTLKCIIYTNDLVAPDDNIEIPPEPRGVKIRSFDEFVNSGNTTAFPPCPPKPDTCAVVMYTSGSTGKPKGVLITHRQIIGAVSAGEIALGIRRGEDVYLAYLPLAHIMEMMAEFALIGMGCALCYADPKSLSATGAFPVGALEKFSPTIMIAVPKIWDVIKKGIEAKVSHSSPVAQFLVKTAFQWRAICLSIGIDSPLFKVLVFKKFKKAVGGKLRYGVSGGGPLNGEVQEFIRVAFGIDLVQGYGLTETCAGLTIQSTDDLRTGIAGTIIPSCQVKLESTPKVGDKAGQPYLATDRFDVEGEPICGRGEVCIRGSNVSCGYYMMQDKTDEVYDKDGWFHTGDIGQFTKDGALRIVDRKKNLVKLKGGEYIAMEKMEMVYGNSKFVDAVAGGICCYGDGDMDRPVALVQLSEPYTMKWAKENGVKGDFETVKNSKELYDAVMADMLAEHKKSDLSHLEKLVGVALLTAHWTPENGCLTAANKLQRRAVIDQFSEEYQEVKKKGIF